MLEDCEILASPKLISKIKQTLLRKLQSTKKNCLSQLFLKKEGSRLGSLHLKNLFQILVLTHG